jgi:hypothetical protein
MVKCAQILRAAFQRSSPIPVAPLAGWVSPHARTRSSLLSEASVVRAASFLNHGFNESHGCSVEAAARSGQWASADGEAAGRVSGARQSKIRNGKRALPKHESSALGPPRHAQPVRNWAMPSQPSYPKNVCRGTTKWGALGRRSRGRHPPRRRSRSQRLQEICAFSPTSGERGLQAASLGGLARRRASPKPACNVGRSSGLN